PSGGIEARRRRTGERLQRYRKRLRSGGTRLHCARGGFQKCRRTPCFAKSTGERSGVSETTPRKNCRTFPSDNRFPGEPRSRESSDDSVSPESAAFPGTARRILGTLLQFP